MLLIERYRRLDGVGGGGVVMLELKQDVSVFKSVVFGLLKVVAVSLEVPGYFFFFYS